MMRPPAMIDQGDFSVAVKNRGKFPKPWRWEIHRAGRASAIDQSKAFFETATEAARAGKTALAILLGEFPT